MSERIARIVAGAIGAGAPAPEISVPEKEQFGHYATNVAMRFGENGWNVGAGGAGVTAAGKPLARAQALAAKIAQAAPAGFFEKVEAAPPGFVDFWLSAKAIREECGRAAREKHYGKNAAGGGKTIIVEFSSVNIAKPFHLGHLRNTIIGDALARILAASGYDVVRWNYLGDWGTQFGNLIAAYKRWGEKAAVKKDPIAELQKLYVQFHAEAAAKPELVKEGQAEFKKLESGDRGNLELWEWFKKESLAAFGKIYRTLDVPFDEWIGESFFEKEMRPLVAELAEKKIAERSDGALVIRLDEFNLPPALVQKSDGASLYLTRDIANLRYRLAKYKPAKILYVVGNEQSLAFEQLFAIAKKIGLGRAELTHVKYGLVLGEAGKKFSTRRGETLPATEVIAKAVDLARAVVEEKARDLADEEKDAVAEAVALGALKYNDLKENRTTDIVFDWGRMLDFTGDSGPYLQYTFARLSSILRKAPKVVARDFSLLDAAAELALMRKIFEFPDAVRTAGEHYATSILAAYLYELAVAANKFYETTPVLQEEDEGRRKERLALVATAARTLRDGLALLGIRTPEKI